MEVALCCWDRCVLGYFYIWYLWENSKDAFDVTYGWSGGVWAPIVGTINTMHEKGIVPLSSLKKQVGKGRNTSFCFDICLGEIPLKMWFQRLFQLESVKNSSVHDRLGADCNWNWIRQITGGVLKSQFEELKWLIGKFQISNDSDCWKWNL